MRFDNREALAILRKRVREAIPNGSIRLDRGGGLFRTEPVDLRTDWFTAARGVIVPTERAFREACEAKADTPLLLSVAAHRDAPISDASLALLIRLLKHPEAGDRPVRRRIAVALRQKERDGGLYLLAALCREDEDS